MKRFLLINLFMAMVVAVFAVAPPNDNYGSAIALPTAVTNVTTIDATTDGPGSDPACYNVMDPLDIWYTITPAVDKKLVIDGTSGNNHLAIEIMTESGGVFTYKACDKQYGIAHVEFQVTGGQLYYVRAYSAEYSTVTFDLVGELQDITNDDYENAYALPTSVTGGTTVDATIDGPAHTDCYTVNLPEDVWYTVTSVDVKKLVIDVTGTGNHTIVEIMTISGGVFTPIACDYNYGSAHVEYQVTAGQEYHVRVFASDYTNIPFNIIGELQVVTNDNYENAYALPTSVTGGTTVDATIDGPAHTDCYTVNLPEDVWYAVTSADVKKLVIDVTGTGNHTIVEIMTISGGVFTPIACDYNYGSAHVEYQVTAGQEYHVRVFASDYTNIPFDIIGELQVVTNDNYENAYILPTSITGGTTVGATMDGPAHTECGSATIPDDVWYTVESASVKNITIDITNSTIQTYVQIMTESGGVFTHVACNYGYGSASVSAALDAGQEYHVRVFSSDYSNITFDIASVLVDKPSNDDPDDAMLLEGDVTHVVDAIDAIPSSVAVPGQSYANPDDASDNNLPINTECTYSYYDGSCDDLWYYVETLDAGGNVTIDITANGANTHVFLYADDQSTVLDCQFGWGNHSLTYVDAANFDGRKNESSSRTSTTYYVRVFAVGGTTYSITATGAGILPIELGGFSARPEGRSNLILWNTLSEINSDYIEVLSSSTGNSGWNSIGEVEAMGNSNRLQSYEMYDNDPFSQTYYRLKIYDRDGTSSYSNIISVKRDDSAKGMHLSPNPTNDKISMQAMSTTDEVATINIRNLTGKVMVSKTVSLNNGLNDIDVDLTEVLNGVYLFELHTATGVQVEKIIKQ